MSFLFLLLLHFLVTNQPLGTIYDEDDGPPTHTAMSPCWWGEKGVGQQRWGQQEWGQAQQQDRVLHHDNHTTTTTPWQPWLLHWMMGEHSPQLLQAPACTTWEELGMRVGTMNMGHKDAEMTPQHHTHNTPGWPSTPLCLCEQLLAGWMRGARMVQATATTMRQGWGWQWQWQDDEDDDKDDNEDDKDKQYFKVRFGLVFNPQEGQLWTTTEPNRAGPIRFGCPKTTGFNQFYYYFLLCN
jgi:hypothetical protein